MKHEQEAKSFKRTVIVEEKLDYFLFLPTGYHSQRTAGWPLILFLHGSGERGTNLSLIKKHSPLKHFENHGDFPFILVSPQCPEDKVWDVSSLIGLLDEVIAQQDVDVSRIYLTGLSMGGYGAWSLGLAHPERFAAIAPICGGGEIISILLAGQSKREALQSTPMWVFHGAKDPVVPLEESQRMVDVMKRVGVKDIQFTIYPEAEHDSWTETYGNPKLFEWFLQQQRQP